MSDDIDNDFRECNNNLFLNMVTSNLLCPSSSFKEITFLLFHGNNSFVCLLV